MVICLYLRKGEVFLILIKIMKQVFVKVAPKFRSDFFMETKKQYLWDMKTYQIDLLNPKAARLLQDLAELNLISIKETKKENFLEIVAKLRRKAVSNVPTLDEITKEVELVRASRYVKSKRQGYY